MTCLLAILCYHRIVDEQHLATAWPYLERGTAVRAEAFDAQLTAIERFADIIDEGSALEVLAGRRELMRPGVWITFDDGYRDALYAMHRIASGTIFITAGHAGLLPADAWYAVLVGATRPRGVLDLGLGPFEYDLQIREGRSRLVNGPERRAFLRAVASNQEATLRELARQLDAHAQRPRIYLDGPDISDLLVAGWTIGSHGLTHAPFDVLPGDELLREARTSRHVLAARGGTIRSLALPDGAHPTRPLPLRACGYECVLGLGDAVAAPGLAVQPRFLVPDEARWAEHVLRPRLEVGP